MPKSRHRHAVHAALAALALVAAPAGAQTAEQDEDPGGIQSGTTAATVGDVNFILRGGGSYEFETDLDDGGEVSLWAARFGLSAATQLNDQWGLSLFTGVEYLNFDFGGSLGFGALDPWDDVLTFGAVVASNYRLNDQWTLSGGPIFQMAWESGADAGDGIQAGGVFAASYRFNDRLTLGAGFGVISQIEDSAQAFPVLVVDWRINDQLRLLSRRESGAGPFSGTELIWSFSPKWDLALGGNFRNQQRFRLDDSGIAPKGVGRTRAWPLWLRIGFDPTPNIEIDGFVGVLLGGELLLEDDDGKRIADTDVDPVPGVGFAARLRF